MDAVKYLETRKRMSLSGDLSLVHLMEDAVDPEVLVGEVERWSASHPLQTRQSVFLEQYPEASISEHGVLLVCPCPILHRTETHMAAAQPLVADATTAAKSFGCRRWSNGYQ